MKTFRKIDHVVEKIQEYTCFILFLMIVVIGGISVFSRFIFNMSIVWAEEAMRFSCIWLTFIGAALTVRKDGHVSVDIVQGMIKNKNLKAKVYFLSRIVGILFLILLFPPSIALVRRTYNSLAAALPIRFSYIYLAVPVGIVNMLWSYISALPYYTKKQKGDEVASQEQTELKEENGNG